MEKMIPPMPEKDSTLDLIALGMAVVLCALCAVVLSPILIPFYFIGKAAKNCGALTRILK